MNWLTVLITRFLGRHLKRQRYYQGVSALDSKSAYLYYDKIMKFAVTNKIQVWPTLKSSNFALQTRGFPQKNYIVSFTRLQNQNLIIATLLHEMGHIMMWKNGLDSETLTLARRYMNAGLPIWNNEKTIIVLEEKGAWDVGELLAKELDIELGPWFFEIRDIAMRTYMSIESYEMRVEKLLKLPHSETKES